jgi:predicted metal-dependent hydrolase
VARGRFGETATLLYAGGGGQAEGSSFTVHFVRMRRARRYILRVRADGALRVTIPRGGSRAEALRFAQRHLSWAERERARLLASRRPAAQWTAGTSILIDGEAVPIARDGDLVRAGRITVRVPLEHSNLRPALEAALREDARRTLPAQLLALAAAHGLTVTRVTIRNQRSRWGSCSRNGRIALNFRLVQMPPAVREYILLHELMHLRHPNHSRRFWTAVQSVCPAFRDAERWLKKVGQDLF